MSDINIGKKFLYSIFICILIFSNISCGVVYAKAKLELAKKGSYVYWFAYTDALGKDNVTMPMRFKGKKAEIDTKTLGLKYTDAKIYVMDKRTGDLAIVDYSAPKDPKGETPIKLEKDDFQYVRSVKLRIVSEDDAPLESGIVNITDGEGTEMRAIVTPADQGIAMFENVAAGEVNVKVEAGGLKKTIDSDIEIPEKRDAPGFEQDVRVAGDVDTLPVVAKAESSSDKGTKSHAKNANKQSPAAMILQFFAGIIFLAIIGAIVFAIVRAKGITAESALKKMGVQLPQDQVGQNGTIPAPAPAVDPNTCEFCGQRKDASGRCTCSVVPGASPFASPMQDVSSGPRLIGVQGVYSGHIFELSSSVAVVGRESSNAIALPNDSTSSRRHATINPSNGGYLIKDEGSSNGTFVNGAKITEQKLTPGDEIQIGGTKFRFEA